MPWSELNRVRWSEKGARPCVCDARSAEAENVLKHEQAECGAPRRAPVGTLTDRVVPITRDGGPVRRDKRARTLIERRPHAWICKQALGSTPGSGFGAERPTCSSMPQVRRFA